MQLKVFFFKANYFQLQSLLKTKLTFCEPKIKAFKIIPGLLDHGKQIFQDGRPFFGHIISKFDCSLILAHEKLHMLNKSIKKSTQLKY